MRFLSLLLFLSSLGFAQTQQPEKESSSDLRSGLTMFSIEDLEEEKIIWLERTSSLDYFLRSKDEDNQQKIQKITTPDAVKLDREFASKFLKLQYELPSSEEGCTVRYLLVMKGEKQDVCGKDEKKTQEIIPFLQGLEKRF